MDHLGLSNAIEKITRLAVTLGQPFAMNEATIRTEVARAIETAFARTAPDRSGIPTPGGLAANQYVEAFNLYRIDRSDLRLQETCLAAAQRTLDRIFTGMNEDYSRLGKTWRDQLQDMINSIRAGGGLSEASLIPVEGEIEYLDAAAQAQLQAYRDRVNASEFCGVSPRRLRLAHLEYVEQSAEKGRLKMRFVLLLSPNKRSPVANFDGLP